ncbi:MAG: hypothetical protein KAJ55_00280 [Anaerolineales bacterium]|nr:hypothetical protein [Anaerolineales bacterium]
MQIRGDNRPWGFNQEMGVPGCGGNWPLPTTKQFPLRCRGKETEPTWSPYINVWEVDETTLDFMLCDGTGWRASDDPEHKDHTMWIYADGDNVPKEWRSQIRGITRWLKARWPKKRIVFSPKTTPYSTRWFQGWLRK